MGKSRRNRTAVGRADPLAGAPKAVKPPSDPALAALRDAKILPVVSDLRSADPKTRAAAAGAVANLVDDARCRKLLLREQVVHVVLTETLADTALESRAAGWAVLNVLAQHEEADFCVHLFRRDVLTPAAAALAQVRETLGRSDAKLTKAQKEYMWRVASAVLDLVAQLAESRDEVLSAMAQNGSLVQGLCALGAGTSTAATGPVPAEIQQAALAVLTRMCEDEQQRALAETLVDDAASGGLYPVLVKATTTTTNTTTTTDRDARALAVSAAALLHAVYASLEWFDHSPGRDGASDAVLVTALAKVIEKELVDEAEAEAAANDTTVAAAAANETTATDEVLGLALQTLAMIGTTLKASLEKANKDDAAWQGIEDGPEGEGEDADMVDDGEALEVKGRTKGRTKGKHDDAMDVDGGEGEEDDEEDEENSEEEEEGDDDDDDSFLDRDMAEVVRQDDDDDEQTGLEDMATLRALMHDAVPQVLLLVAARADDDAADDAADDDASVAVLVDALSALNNLAWTVSLVDPKDDGNAAILAAWDPVARRIWLKAVRPLLAKPPADLHPDVADQLAGLGWALARVMRGETPARAGEAARFMALRDALGPQAAAAAAAAGDDPFQTLGVKCLGVLGQMALDPAPADANRAIGRYLLDVPSRLPDTPAPAAEVVEALNQLFDVYGDESAACDASVFRADDMLPAFLALTSKVRALAKGIDKRAHAELRTRADEVVLNLTRFIQYKKKQDRLI